MAHLQCHRGPIQSFSQSDTLPFRFAYSSQQPGQKNPPVNPFQNIVLHPSLAIPEQQLDNAIVSLLRNDAGS